MEKRIMLVEDDKYIALALKIRLKAEGFQVSVVDDKATALQEVETCPPDIALVDYNLPDGNGFEVLQHFADSPVTASVFTIIMTASKLPALREQAMSLGAVEFFEKPFKSADLIACIEKLQPDRSSRCA